MKYYTTFNYIVQYYINTKILHTNIHVDIQTYTYEYIQKLCSVVQTYIHTHKIYITIRYTCHNKHTFIHTFIQSYIKTI